MADLDGMVGAAMEILTLLKANIRRKKGSFISIVVLTFLIMATAAAVLGIRHNYEEALKKAHEHAQIGNSNAFIADSLLTQELLDSVKNSPLVDHVKVDQAIVTQGYATVGEEKDSNSYFLLKMREEFRLYREDEDGYADTIPKLREGEIYLPYGLKSKLTCEMGDTISIGMADGIHDFTIKGFIEEAINGGMMMGWKQVAISDADYERFREELAAYETEKQTSYMDVVRIYKADESLSDARFQRKLNLETGIIDQANGSLTGEQSSRYTGLFLEIITGVMLGFVAVLFVIVLVVIAHSIKTETEIDYVNLGILKSQGFTSSKITGLLVLRYLVAELAGIFLGIGAGIPIERALSRIFFSITAILPLRSIAILPILLVVAGILILSVLIIFVCTRKVAHISPVRAISGGRREIYFSNRCNARISGKCLLPSLAMRNFTSDKKRYVGIIFIAALLTFFAVTVNVLDGAVKSRAALENMGYVITDLGITLNQEDMYDHVNEIEEMIEKHSKIEKKYYFTNGYLSLNGENLFVEIYQYPEVISGILEGRKPLYDNEIVITEMVADTLGLHMGDEVTVRRKGEESVYLISGIYQTMNDSGMAFAMSLEGAKKIGVKQIAYLGIVLEDASQSELIAEELKEHFGDKLQAEADDGSFDSYMGVFDLAVLVIQIMIYAFSVVFTLVSVIMVCSKAFIRERTDIGIYKAIGFTSGKLRMQFAIRFFMVALIGSVVGAFAGAWFSVDVINLVFRLFGVSSVTTDNTMFTYITAVAFISICVFVFSYLVSGKMKRVEIKELVTE